MNNLAYTISTEMKPFLSESENDNIHILYQLPVFPKHKYFLIQRRSSQMYNIIISIILFVFVTNIPAAFSAGGKVTIHNARYVDSLKYKSKDKEHVISFDPQNEEGQYRLKGKRNFQVLEVYVKEQGKEKVCKCNEDALFRWRTRHPVNISYKSESEGYDGISVDITGTYDRKFKEIQCPCELKNQ